MQLASLYILNSEWKNQHCSTISIVCYGKWHKHHELCEVPAKTEKATVWNKANTISGPRKSFPDYARFVYRVSLWGSKISPDCKRFWEASNRHFTHVPCNVRLSTRKMNIETYIIHERDSLSSDGGSTLTSVQIKLGMKNVPWKWHIAWKAATSLFASWDRIPEDQKRNKNK